MVKVDRVLSLIQPDFLLSFDSANIFVYQKYFHNTNNFNHTHTHKMGCIKKLWRSKTANKMEQTVQNITNQGNSVISLNHIEMTLPHMMGWAE